MTNITNAFIFYRVEKKASGGLVLYFYTLDIYLFHAGFYLPKIKLLVLKDNPIIAETLSSYKKKTWFKLENITRFWEVSGEFHEQRKDCVTAKDLNYNTN